MSKVIHYDLENTNVRYSWPYKVPVTDDLHKVLTLGQFVAAKIPGSKNSKYYHTALFQVMAVSKNSVALAERPCSFANDEFGPYYYDSYAGAERKRQWLPINTKVTHRYWGFILNNEGRISGEQGACEFFFPMIIDGRPYIALGNPGVDEFAPGPNGHMNEPELLVDDLDERK